MDQIDELEPLVERSAKCMSMVRATLPEVYVSPVLLASPSSPLMVRVIDLRASEQRDSQSGACVYFQGPEL
jgi:hypothetical protein